MSPAVPAALGIGAQVDAVQAAHALRRAHEIARAGHADRRTVGRGGAGRAAAAAVEHVLTSFGAGILAKALLRQADRRQTRIGRFGERRERACPHARSSHQVALVSGGALAVGSAREAIEALTERAGTPRHGVAGQQQAN
jgi:hypothetical protein